MPVISQDIKTGLKAIAWFVLVVLSILCAPVILQWSPLLFLALALVAGLTSTGLYFLLRLARRNSDKVRGFDIARAALLGILLANILVAIPVYTIALKVALDPVMMPHAVISNGEKTVVFQGMVHVGAESFYKSVVFDLEEALNKGYVLYYEGVQPSSGEGDAWFSQYLAGGGSLDTNYQALADICGINYQLNYFGLLVEDQKINPERHVAADVNTLEMKQEFDRLLVTDPAFAREMADYAPESQKDSGTTSVIDWLQQGSQGQRNIAGSLCRGLLAMTLAGDTTGPLNPVILDFRNRALVERILEDDNDKIFITYGAAHLPGVLELLKSASPPWEVVSMKWLQGITTPIEADTTDFQ